MVADEKPEKARGAILQFEIDISRFAKVTANGTFVGAYGETSWHRLRHIAQTCINDVITNGGTFVMVRNGKTVTMVQRPEGTDL